MTYETRGRATRVTILAGLLLVVSCASRPVPDVVPPPVPDVTYPRRIAVIDHFYPGDDAFASSEDRDFALIVYDAVDVDGDGIRDACYHGDLIRVFASGEGIEIVPYPVHGYREPKREILLQLRRLARQVRDGIRIDAAILAWESSTLISALGGSIDPARIADYKKTIESWGADSVSWHLTYRIILAIEDLASAGVDVYTIAGNSGRGAVNTYSFARGVVTVGAEEPGARGGWISHNALVTRVAKSVYRVRLIRPGGYTGSGYDLDEDGVADVPYERLSRYADWPSRPPRESHVVLRGSSFAAPTAARRVLAAVPRR
jgi:hypothetical protein